MKMAKNSLPKTQLFGFDFINDDSYKALITSILHFNEEYEVASKKLPILLSPNVDIVVKTSKPENAIIGSILKNSFYIIPDGQPIVWSSLFFRHKRLKKRLTGSELFPLLWKEILRLNRRVLLIASSERIGEMLKKELPSLTYYVPPYFDPKNKEQVDRMFSEIVKLYDRVQPEIVFSGLGFPKQEIITLKLIDYHNRKFANDSIQNLVTIDDHQYFLFPSSVKVQHALHLPIGASYEFYLGLKKRAPKFFQLVGLEWLYRFFQEPKRLFARYFIDDLKFFIILLKELRGG